MRSPILAVIAVFNAWPVQAEEPLFLRIRPNTPAEVAGSAGVADEAAAARARREAVWARSDARARIAIASVCTGCMKPMPDPPPVPPARHSETEIASNSDVTAAAGAPAPTTDPAPSATVLVTAGEP